MIANPKPRTNMINKNTPVAGLAIRLNAPSRVCLVFSTLIFRNITTIKQETAAQASEK